MVGRAGTIYQLDRQTYSLVEAIDAFNALSPENKSGGNAFIQFAHIKGLAEEVGAELDQFLLSEKIVVPSEIALDIIQEEGGRISFAPKIDGVKRKINPAFFNAYFASDGTPNMSNWDKKVIFADVDVEKSEQFGDKNTIYRYKKAPVI